MAFGAQTPTPAIGTVETILVDSRVVACDGGDGPAGPPASLAAHRAPADLLPILLARVRARARRRRPTIINDATDLASGQVVTDPSPTGARTERRAPTGGRDASAGHRQPGAGRWLGHARHPPGREPGDPACRGSGRRACKASHAASGPANVQGRLRRKRRAPTA